LSQQEKKRKKEKKNSNNKLDQQKCVCAQDTMRYNRIVGLGHIFNP
jgi:hypothetical protein